MIAINPVTDRHTGELAERRTNSAHQQGQKDTPAAANNTQVEPKLKESWPASRRDQPGM